MDKKKSRSGWKCDIAVLNKIQGELKSGIRGGFGRIIAGVIGIACILQFVREPGNIYEILNFAIFGEDIRKGRRIMEDSIFIT